MGFADRRERHRQRRLHCRLALQRELEPLCSNPRVQEMRRFVQHGDTTTWQHCWRVAWFSYRICLRLGLDARAAARGAMLHDLFLYDWHRTSMHGMEHATRHPEIALHNACEIADLSPCEQDIILSHMWPLTRKLPGSPEAMVVSMMDKYAATTEVTGYLWRRMLDVRYRYWNLMILCVHFHRAYWMA